LSLSKQLGSHGVEHRDYPDHETRDVPTRRGRGSSASAWTRPQTKGAANPGLRSGANVKAEAVAVLRCPRCRTDGMLALTAWGTDDVEVGEGPLDCQICAAAFRVADLLHEPPESCVARRPRSSGSWA
jgi:uncharacterized protein YbaR (Trm112 family)